MYESKDWRWRRSGWGIPVAADAAARIADVAAAVAAGIAAAAAALAACTVVAALGSAPVGYAPARWLFNTCVASAERRQIGMGRQWIGRGPGGTPASGSRASCALTAHPAAHPASRDLAEA